MQRFDKNLSLYLLNAQKGFGNKMFPDEKNAGGMYFIAKEKAK